MRKKISIISALIIVFSMSAAFTAGNSKSAVISSEKGEDTSFESCGKNSGKGCKKETKDKFPAKKRPVIKTENQK